MTALGGTSGMEGASQRFQGWAGRAPGWGPEPQGWVFRWTRNRGVVSVAGQNNREARNTAGPVRISRAPVNLTLVMGVRNRPP